MKRATSVARDQLVSLGVCVGKFTHSDKFRLTIGALELLAAHAKHKVRPPREKLRMRRSRRSRMTLVFSAAAGWKRLVRSSARFSFASAPRSFRRPVMRRISVFNLNLCDEKRLIPRALEGRRDASTASAARFVTSFSFVVTNEGKDVVSIDSFRLGFVFVSASPATDPFARRVRRIDRSIDLASTYAFSTQMWVKPTSEMSFLYGNHLLKSGLGRITENTPANQGVVVFSMSDVPLGFGVAAKSTQDCRKLDASSIVAFHQADVGEYLRAEDDMVQGKKE